MHVRVCGDCGEEYRPEIAVCADCGGVLEDRYEAELDERQPSLPPPQAPEREDAELVGYRALYVTGHAATLVPLAERLREAAIAFRLHQTPKGAAPEAQRRYPRTTRGGTGWEVDEDPSARAATFSLLVRDEDAGRAMRELAPLLGGIDEPDRLHAVESEFEAGAYRRCPACRTELPAGAAECPECGLGLGQTVAACARCGAPLETSESECAACGPA